MKKYQSYKSSGVEWIGEIPDHWVIKKMKYFVKICNGSDYKDFVVEDGGFPVYGTGGIFSRCSKFLYDKPSVLLGRKGSVDRPQFVNEPFWTSDTTYYTQIKENVSPMYFFHLVKQIQFDQYIYGSAIPSMTKSVYDEMLFPYPPFSEQLLIVQFLDKKTELIDKLISTKERKITLLKQQRTSLINEVITKGLNPNVKMKDSGVEWIGEIPEHWEVFKLKNISDLRISSVDKHILENENQVRVCNYTDVYYNEFISQNINFRNGSCSDDELQKYTLNKGDVIITKDSESPNDIGVPSLVVEDFDNLVCGYHLSIIKPDISKMIGSFLFRQLQTQRIRNYYEICSNGITRFGLGKSSVLETPLIKPPLIEQQQIVEYLDTHIKEIEDLVSMEKNKIDLLKEYRQSLISEVITGKIDVRNYN